VLAAIIALACRFGLHPRDLPSALDQYAPWAAKRQLASAAGTRGVLFVGTSQLRAAVAIPRIRACWPRCVPVELGLNGCATIDVLDDLARDPAIRGLVVVDYTPHVEFRLLPDPSTLPRRWIGRFHGSEPAATLRELPMSYRFLHFVGNPAYSWTRLFARLTREDAEVVATDADRDLLYDYTRYDPDRLAADQVKRYEPVRGDGEAVATFARRLAEDVRMIRARGGEVVVVHLPIGRRIRERDDRIFPQAAYFAPVAASGALMLECRDDPLLSAFDPPDSLHLDLHQAPEFDRLMLLAITHRLADAKDDDLLALVASP
jgi:hypothetical protein